MTLAQFLPPRVVVRREAGLYAMEQALRRRGFVNLVGVDEAGRGACAGPLVAGAVLLGEKTSISGLADSKMLTAANREELYQEIVSVATAWSAVVISSRDIDTYGLHVCNVRALRQAVSRLNVKPDYILSDGFKVDGLGGFSLGVWKGDQILASVAAASIVAKVTRDRLMCQLDQVYPQYQFAQHKGYNTPAHLEALARYGPCPEHRQLFSNVQSVQAASP